MGICENCGCDSHEDDLSLLCGECSGARNEYMAILKYVRDGRFVSDQSGLWRGPYGLNHDPETHTLLKAALISADPSEVDRSIHPLDRYRRS